MNTFSNSLWLGAALCCLAACSQSETLTVPPSEPGGQHEQVSMNPAQTCNCPGSGPKGVVRQGSINGVPVWYEEVNGMAIYEGDIILSPDQTAASSGGRTSGVVISNSNFTWPNKTFYYTIDPALPNPQRVTNAIQLWRSKSTLRFVERTNQPNYVVFRPSSGCSSAIGMRGGRQFVNLSNGCGLWATVHEIGHALGLWHEQSRNDRDRHIVVHYENIQNGQAFNFNKAGNSGTDTGPFDFQSLMLYDSYSYSKNGQPTMTKLDGSVFRRTANISKGDSAAIRALYP